MCECVCVPSSSSSFLPQTSMCLPPPLPGRLNPIARAKRRPLPWRQCVLRKMIRSGSCWRLFRCTADSRRNSMPLCTGRCSLKRSEQPLYLSNHAFHAHSASSHQQHHIYICSLHTTPYASNTSPTTCYTSSSMSHLTLCLIYHTLPTTPYLLHFPPLLNPQHLI